MRILRIYTRIAPEGGGMENHISRLTSIQNECDVNVTIAFSKGKKVSSNDIKIVIPQYLNILPQAVGLFYLHLVVFFTVLFKQKKFDIIHVHGDWSSLLLLNWLKRVTKSRKCILSIHGQLEKSRFKDFMWKLFLHNVDGLHSTGYQAIQHLKNLGYNGRVLLRPSGIEDIFLRTAKVRLSKNVVALNVVVVAQMRPNKNLLKVIEIARALQDIRFTIIGDGEQFEVILASAKDLQNVVFMGNQDKYTIQKVMSDSHVILSTSLREGTPTSILEGIANGLVYVASNAGNISHTLKNYSGRIITDGSTKSYIDAIRTYHNNPDLLEQHSRNNHRKGHLNAWPLVASEITQLIVE